MNKYTLFLTLLVLPFAIVHSFPQLLSNYAGIKLLAYEADRHCSDCLEAITTFIQKTSSMSSNEKLGLSLRVRAYLIANHPVDAVAYLKKRGLWPPPDLSLRVLLVKVLSRNKHWSQMEELMTAGWKSNAALAAEMDRLGRDHEAHLDFANARSAYRTGFAACPDAAAGIASLQHLAELTYRQGDLDRAIILYRELAGAIPGSAPLRGELARIMLERGYLEQAFAEASGAINLDPKYPGGYAVRGSYYWLKGDANRAIADLESAERLAGNTSPWNQLTLSQAYAKLGRRNTACTTLTALTKSHPSFMPAIHLFQSICATPW